MNSAKWDSRNKCQLLLSKKKATDSKKISALQDTFEVLGKDTVLPKGPYCSGATLPAPGSCAPTVLSTRRTCDQSQPSSGLPWMPLALRKGPVNQSWRDRMEELRPGPDSRGSKKWIHLLEHMAKGTWNVRRVSHQVHRASPQSPAHRLMGTIGRSSYVNSVVYIPTNRNYFQISFCFILSIAYFPFINAEYWKLTIIHYALFYFIIHQTY